MPRKRLVAATWCPGHTRRPEPVTDGLATFTPDGKASQRTGPKAKMPFGRLVEILVQKPFRPEPLRLIIYLRIVVNAPVVPGKDGAGREAVALKFVILCQGVGNVAE